MRRVFAPGFVNYKKGALDSKPQVIYQLLAHGRWFSPGTPTSSTTKTDRHDIAEILLKVALKHQKSKYQSNHIQVMVCFFFVFCVYLFFFCFGILHFASLFIEIITLVSYSGTSLTLVIHFSDRHQRYLYIKLSALILINYAQLKKKLCCKQNARD